MNQACPARLSGNGGGVMPKASSCKSAASLHADRRANPPADLHPIGPAIAKAGFNQATDAAHRLSGDTAIWSGDDMRN